MSTPTVRRFEQRDFESLVAQWHDTNRSTYWYSEVHQRHTLCDAEAFFRDVVLAACEVFVAECDGVAAGLIAIEPPWIRQLTVFPAFQRKGIGRTLLDKAREISHHELRLFTFQRNAGARRFYEATGFVPVRFGTSPAPESEPDVEYVWRHVIPNA